MNYFYRWGLFLLVSCGSVLLHGVESIGHTYNNTQITEGYGLYTDNCALCHGLEGSWVEGVDLSRGQFKSVVSDHDLSQVIMEGAAEGRMPAFSFEDSQIDSLIAYIRVGFDPEGAAVQIGSVSAGKSVFNGEGGCGACHRVKGKGPRTAPDLSDIGLVRTPAALRRTLIDPSKAIWPIHRPVIALTKTGEAIYGRRLNEDTYTVQIIDSQERLISLDKADLVQYEVDKELTHQPTTLSDEEVADLVAYMLSLRGEL
jgi:putative heme-binding domain-containing protein